MYVYTLYVHIYIYVHVCNRSRYVCITYIVCTHVSIHMRTCMFIALQFWYALTSTDRSGEMIDIWTQSCVLDVADTANTTTFLFSASSLYLDEVHERRGTMACILQGTAYSCNTLFEFSNRRYRFRRVEDQPSPSKSFMFWMIGVLWIWCFLDCGCRTWTWSKATGP